MVGYADRVHLVVGDLEVFGCDLELRGGDFEQLLVRVACCLFDGGVVCVGDLRVVVDAVVWCVGCVVGGDMYVVFFYVEGLGGDRCECVLDVVHVGCCGDDRQFFVVVELADRGGGFQAVGLEVEREFDVFVFW